MSIPRPEAAPALSGMTRGWGLLAVAALAVAGVLALLVALARTPGVQDLLPDGLFRAALVVHVVFAFVVFYLGFLGLMSVWAAARLGRPAVRAARGGLALGVMSFMLLVAPAVAGRGAPSLNNYVPVLDHWAFHAGLSLLFAAVAVPVLAALRALAAGGWAAARSQPAAAGIALAGLIYLLALTCIGLAWAGLPDGMDTVQRYEALYWGGGHVLQFVHTTVMLAAWHRTAERLHGTPPLGARAFLALLAALVLAAAAGPLFYLLWPVNDGRLSAAFTEQFRYGLVVQPLVVGAAVALALARRGLRWRDPEAAGLALSLLLFAVGGGLGYAVGHGDTRTPAHYHLVIGGVTLAFMVLLLHDLAPRPPEAAGRRRRALAAMVWLYGLGQLVHAGGLFVAGTLGIARKTAGAAQGLDTPLAKATMAVMGTGAGVAVIGGALFVAIALSRLWRLKQAATPGTG